jgi:hypothetical protein
MGRGPDHLSRRRIEDVERTFVGGIAPSAVDEEMCVLSYVFLLFLQELCVKCESDCLGGCQDWRLRVGRPEARRR